MTESTGEEEFSIRVGDADLQPESFSAPCTRAVIPSPGPYRVNPCFSRGRNPPLTAKNNHSSGHHEPYRILVTNKQ